MTATTSITVCVPMKIRRRPGRKMMVMPTLAAGSGTTVATRADPALVKALARAFRYQKLLDEGRYASISEMATAEKLERGYLGSLLRLTLLAPDIVQSILDGHAQEEMSLPRVLDGFPVSWAEQSERFSSRCAGRGHGARAILSAPMLRAKDHGQQPRIAPGE